MKATGGLYVRSAVGARHGFVEAQLQRAICVDTAQRGVVGEITAIQAGDECLAVGATWICRSQAACSVSNA